MVIKNVNLETVCGITSKLPDHTLPEIAFAGKSNVGKSSLINALMNRKRACQNFGKTWENTDHQLLQYQRRNVSGGPSGIRLCKGFRAGEAHSGES